MLVNSDLETNRRDLRDPTTGHTTIDKGVKVQLDILREVMRVRGSSVAQRRGAAERSLSWVCSCDASALLPVLCSDGHRSGDAAGRRARSWI